MDQYKQELERLSKEESDVAEKLRGSETAYSSSTPTTEDLTNQARMRKLQVLKTNAENQIQKAKWYGPEKDTQQVEGGASEMFGNVLDILSLPLYITTGAYKHLSGKSSADSLIGSVVENVTKHKDTPGSLLKRTGTPYALSAPLGFALDVMFDPVNWATMGTAALIPRVATGLVKGTARGGISTGLKAAGAGVTSSLGKKVFNAGTLLNKLTPGKTVKGNIDIGLHKLAGRTFLAGEQYDELLGRDVIADLVKKPLSGKLKSGFEAVSGKTGTSGYADKFMKNFMYSNTTWVHNMAREQRLIDMMESRSASDLVAAFNKYKETGSLDEIERIMETMKKIDGSGRVSRALNETFERTNNFQRAIMAVGKELGVENSDNLMKMFEDMEATKMLFKNNRIFIGGSTVDRIEALANEKYFDENQKDILRATASAIDEEGKLKQPTGFKFFDSFMDGLRAGKVGNIKLSTKDGEKVIEAGKKTLSGYETIMALFRSGKIGGSLSSWTNALIGNVAMTAMSGINPFDTLFLRRLKDTRKMMSGGDASIQLLQDLVTNKAWQDMAVKNPRLFAATYGDVPQEMSRRVILNQAIKVAQQHGIVKAEDISLLAVGLTEEIGKTIEEVLVKSGRKLDAHTKDLINQQIRGILREEALTGKNAKSAKNVSALKGKSALEHTREAIEGGDPNVATTGIISQEILSNDTARAVLDSFKEKAAEKDANPIYKVLDFMFNKMPDKYESIDQTFKRSIMQYVAIDGVTESELKILSRQVDLKNLFPDKDVGEYGFIKKIQGPTGPRYQLGGYLPMLIANETYLNYAAMPGIVRMLRQAPIVGAPFVSFMYGMGTRAIKTAYSNPAMFNKTSFAIENFSGEKTPLERSAIAGKYYKHLDAPAMFRVPFIDDSPLYVNLTNAIPYYSFNMFTPSERRYEGPIGQMVEMFDRTPIFKDPVGQIIFDYLIQPTILRDTVPIGSFGQPLYPYEASGLTRAAYMGRSALDIPIPGIASLPVGSLTPEKWAELLPMYRARLLSRAKAGKNVYGIQTKEGKLSRTFRGLLGSLGIPVQSPLNLDYSAKEALSGIEEQ